MTVLTTIARPYAEAVARLAGEGGNWAAWSGMLELLAAVAADESVAGLAANPSVSAEQVREIVLAVCGDALDAEGANFAGLLVENKRLAALPEIVRLFEEARAAREGKLEARITSAYDLAPGQMEGLVAALERKFGQKIIATQEVDAGLIGGVSIQVGDKVLDASVRGRLAELAATLKG